MVCSAPVAQLDRATGFYPVGCGFESLRGYQYTNAICIHQNKVAKIIKNLISEVFLLSFLFEFRSSKSMDSNSTRTSSHQTRSNLMLRLSKLSFLLNTKLQLEQLANSSFSIDERSCLVGLQQPVFWRLVKFVHKQGESILAHNHWKTR